MKRPQYTIVYTWRGEKYRDLADYTTLAAAQAALHLFRMDRWNAWIEVTP